MIDQPRDKVVADREDIRFELQLVASLMGLARERHDAHPFELLPPRHVFGPRISGDARRADHEYRPVNIADQLEQRD